MGGGEGGGGGYIFKKEVVLVMDASKNSLVNSYVVQETIPLFLRGREGGGDHLRSAPYSACPVFKSMLVNSYKVGFRGGGGDH